MKQVRSRLREQERPDKRTLKAELNRLDTQIGNVVDSLSDLGRSKALTAKLRDLEEVKTDIENQPAVEAEIVPEVESCYASALVFWKISRAVAPIQI